jgi:hypothetical protein
VLLHVAAFDQFAVDDPEAHPSHMFSTQYGCCRWRNSAERWSG